MPVRVLELPALDEDRLVEITRILMDWLGLALN